MVTEPNSSSWLVSRARKSKPQLRLFCIPYAGGGASIFRTWANHLPRFIEVFSIQMPGRGVRVNEPAWTDLSMIVKAVSTAMAPYVNEPFALFGHSMGAIISFEVANELEIAHSVSPVHLFVSGRVAPHLQACNPVTYHLPESEFVSELRRLEGTPKEVLDNPELMQLVLPVLRADFRVCQLYEYSAKPPVSCPISAFGGLQDREVRKEHLEAWKMHTTGSFSLRMFPGGHFFLHTHELALLHAMTHELHLAVSAKK